MLTFRFGIKLHSTVSHKINGQSNIMELLMQKENTNENYYNLSLSDVDAIEWQAHKAFITVILCPKSYLTLILENAIPEKGLE